MSFLVAHHTDIGNRKKTNQDALLIKTAETPDGEVGLFVICDGMGGLSYGELASATVVRGLSDWFDNDLSEMLKEAAGYTPNLEHQSQAQFPSETIVQSLENTIHELNDKIIAYGKSQNKTMGTTLTALLIIYGQYAIFQIGDSRAYRLSGNQLTQLTRDQTLVAREIARGNLTPEQARNHPQRNVLLQCVGAQNNIKVDITTGSLQTPEFFILCTDGLYRELAEGELAQAFSFGKKGQPSLSAQASGGGDSSHANLISPSGWDDAEGTTLLTDHPSLTGSTHRTSDNLHEKARELVDLVKARGETDNISIIAIEVT